MPFNLDPIYKRKSKKPNNPPLKFNKDTVTSVPIEKLFGLNLNEKLNVNHYFTETITKATTGVCRSTCFEKIE